MTNPIEMTEIVTKGAVVNATTLIPTPEPEKGNKCQNPDCYGGKLREKFPGRVQYIKDCPTCKGTGEKP